jgi:hypothetical protein
MRLPSLTYPVKSEASKLNSSALQITFILLSAVVLRAVVREFLTKIQ